MHSNSSNSEAAAPVHTRKALPIGPGVVAAAVPATQAPPRVMLEHPSRCTRRVCGVWHCGGSGPSLQQPGARAFGTLGCACHRERGGPRGRRVYTVAVAPRGGDRQQRSALHKTDRPATRRGVRRAYLIDAVIKRTDTPQIGLILRPFSTRYGRYFMRLRRGRLGVSGVDHDHDARPTNIVLYGFFYPVHAGQR